jgi:hypothetical protein
MNNTSTATLLVPPNSSWGRPPVPLRAEFFEGRNDQGLKKERNWGIVEGAAVGRHADRKKKSCTSREDPR